MQKTNLPVSIFYNEISQAVLHIQFKDCYSTAQKTNKQTNKQIMSDLQQTHNNIILKNFLYFFKCLSTFKLIQLLVELHLYQMFYDYHNTLQLGNSVSKVDHNS